MLKQNNTKLEWTQRSAWVLKSEWIQSLNNVDIINSYFFIEEVKKEILKFIHMPFTFTSNGTSALYLGMLALGLKENDEIILPTFGYPAVNNLAKLMKLNIKYCDIKIDTFCMDPEYLKTIISKNTKVVCFINHLGYVGEDILYIADICKQYNVLFFEDSAQGLGQYYQNKMAGTFGEFGIISFSGAKIISCDGGGIIYSKHKHIIDNVKKMQNIENIEGMGNYQMGALTMYLLMQQFRDWDWIVKNKIRIHNIYSKYIKLQEPFQADKFIGYNSLVYLAHNINVLRSKLQKNKMMFRYKFYPIQKILDNALNVFNNYIEIPQSFSLTEDKIKNICNIIKISEMEKLI